MQPKPIRHKQSLWRTKFAQLQLLLAVAASILALSSVNVQAALTFTKGQTDDGLRYVLVAGEFEFKESLGEFSRIVTTHQPDFVSFNSGGGNVAKAMELGRLIRGRGLNTLQLRANECASACSLAFMGGVKRFAEPGSIGVHKSSYTGQTEIDTDTAISSIQDVTGDILSYLIEMGIDPALLAVALKVESHDIRYLTLSEMTKYRIVTLQEPPRPHEGQTPPAKEPERDLAAIPPDQSETAPKPQQPSPSPEVSKPSPPPVSPTPVPGEDEIRLKGRWDYKANCPGEVPKSGTLNIHDHWHTQGSAHNSQGLTAVVNMREYEKIVHMRFNWSDRSVTRITGYVQSNNLITGRDSEGCSYRLYRFEYLTMVSQIQTELNRLGCNAGLVDGLWGDQSRTALKRYYESKSLKFTSLEPDEDLLSALKSQQSPACKLECPPGYVERNGTCSRTSSAVSAPSTSGGAWLKYSCEFNGQRYGYFCGTRIKTRCPNPKIHGRYKTQKECGSGRGINAD